MKNYTISKVIIIAALFLLIPSTYTFSQEKSRVAIIPFEAREVSKSEAQVITELFETALVKTGVYNIIEQNQIEAIAEAQAYSLSGCVDDSCAVEVGKLLSAELIVIGTISKVGNKYIANSKIIDVALGKNIKADSVSADNLAQMTETKISFLAFKLAGLTYSENGNEQIASNFGEIYVGTDPPGAEVFINGMRRGTSPMVVEKIPFGQVVVNVKKGNMVAESSVNINSSDLLELDLKLEIALGRLFIKSNDQNLTVALDDNEIGLLGSGIFRDIATGDHILSLRGDGMYYEERITINQGKTTSIEAYPSPVGKFSYKLPEGVQLSVSGGRASYNNLQGSGEIENVFTGRYKLGFTPQNVSFPEDELLLLKGSILSIIPEEYFRENVNNIIRGMKSQEDNFFKLNTQAAELENDLHLLSEAGIKYSGIDSIIQTMKQQLLLYGNIQSKRNELNGINEQLSSLKSERENIEPYYKSANFQKNIYPWISIPIGTGFLGLGFYTIIASAIEGSDLEVSTLVIGVGGVGLGISGLVTGIVFGTDKFEDPGSSVASEYRAEIIKKGQSMNRWPLLLEEEKALNEKKSVLENELSTLESEYRIKYPD